MAAEHVIYDQTNLLPRAQLITVFTALAFAQLIQFIDQNCLSVALPTIGHDLNSSRTIVWAGTSGLIANTAFQVVYGRVSDIFGRKPILILCLCLLTIGDLLCSFAQTGTQLYVFRGVSGIAQGGVMALILMIVSDITTLQDRGRYQGILGSCVGMGNVIAPFLSAGMSQHVTWRATFWLLAPFGVIMSCVLHILVPAQTIPREPVVVKLSRIDWMGMCSSTAGTVLLLIPISGLGTQFRVSDPMVISMLGIGSICILLFIIIEYRFARLPMIPLHLFNSGPLAAMMVQNWLIGLCYFSMLYYLPIFYQTTRQMTPIQSASLMVPLVISQALASVATGQYMSRKGRYGELIWAGYTLWLIAAGLQLLFNRTIRLVAIVIILVIQGIGTGLVFQSTLVAQQAHSPKKDRAVVISARNFLRSLGGACGLAICSPIFSNTLLRSLSQNLPSIVVSDVKDTIFHLPNMSSLSQSQRLHILDAFGAASKAVFYVWVSGMACCLSLMVLVKDKGLMREEEKITSTAALSLGNVRPEINMASVCRDGERSVGVI